MKRKFTLFAVTLLFVALTMMSSPAFRAAPATTSNCQTEAAEKYRDVLERCRALPNEARRDCQEIARDYLRCLLDACHDPSIACSKPAI
jgi:hypothetical protein